MVQCKYLPWIKRLVILFVPGYTARLPRFASFMPGLSWPGDTGAKQGNLAVKPRDRAIPGQSGVTRQCNPVQIKWPAAFILGPPHPGRATTKPNKIYLMGVYRETLNPLSDSNKSFPQSSSKTVQWSRWVCVCYKTIRQKFVCIGTWDGQ